MNYDLFSLDTSDAAKLTVLSMGLGQDSTALLYKYAYDAEFRMHYAPNDFLVIFSDTGNEFDETYRHLEHVKAFCKLQDIEFVHLTADMAITQEIGRAWSISIMLRAPLGLRHILKSVVSG